MTSTKKSPGAKDELVKPGEVYRLPKKADDTLPPAVPADRSLVDRLKRKRVGSSEIAGSGSSEFDG